MFLAGTSIVPADVTTMITLYSNLDSDDDCDVADLRVRYCVMNIICTTRDADKKRTQLCNLSGENR